MNTSVVVLTTFCSFKPRHSFKQVGAWSFGFFTSWQRSFFTMVNQRSNKLFTFIPFRRARNIQLTVVIIFTVIKRNFQCIGFLFCELWPADYLRIQAWQFWCFSNLTNVDIVFGIHTFNTGSSIKFNLCEEPCGNSHQNQQNTGWLAGR